VKPQPATPIQLFSFETGTEGWAAAWWEPGAGTVEQSPDFATDGAYSLGVAVADTGWFGLTFWPPLDLSAGYTVIQADLQVGDNNGSGTWHNIAIHTGDAWVCCQGPGEWLADGTTTTVQLDLLSLSCGEADLSKVQSLLVYWNGDGWMDNIWAM
jgi:mannan endo-1,4-beta-mannosidase